MANLMRRQNGVFYVKVRLEDGREIRQSLKTRNRRDAMKMLHAVEREIIQAQLTGRLSEVMNFEEAWKTYHAALVNHKKYSSIRCEQAAWEKFSKWCQSRGIMTIQSIKVGDVAIWQSTLVSEGKAAAGVNNRLRMCKCILNHLIRLEVFSGNNPFTKVKVLKENNKVKFLPWEKVQEFVELSKGVNRDIHLVFVLGAYAGLRKDEILRARWEHVEWDQNRMWIDGTKSSASSDYVPLHAALKAALEPYKEESGYIVRPSKKVSGAPNSYRWEWDRTWARVEQAEAAAAAEREEESAGHVSPHQLRHSVATHLLDIGYNLQQVAVFLRHSSDIPTRKYANLKGVKLQIDRF